jgi:DNA repair exonuclease SbcCD ATPase subunit
LESSAALIQHLNDNMMEALTRADDKEAQLVSATQQLDQLMKEHADVTRVLIEAKVEIAEKKGRGKLHFGGVG